MEKLITPKPKLGVTAHVRPYREWSQIADYLIKQGRCPRLCDAVVKWGALIESENMAMMVLREDQDEINATLQAANDLGLDPEEEE